MSLEIGCRVLLLDFDERAEGQGIEERRVEGLVKFFGLTTFAPGVWIGVQLDAAEGLNNGSIDGVYYFSCEPKYGVFVRHHTVVRLGGIIVMSDEKDKRPAFTQDQKERIKKNREAALALKKSQEAANTLLQLHNVVRVLPAVMMNQAAVKVKRVAFVEMPDTGVGKVKANAPTSDVRKRKFSVKDSSTNPGCKTTRAVSMGNPRKMERNTKIGRACTEHRLCHDVHNDFPFEFRYGRNALRLVVRENTSSRPENTTYIFSFLQQGQIMAGSAEVSTKITPRLMNFRFDVTNEIEAGIAELALRAIILFMKLQCPGASQFDNDVMDANDRHPSCTKQHLKDFLKKVDLFQRTNRAAEVYSDCAGARKKIFDFLEDRINGRIIQDPI